MRNVVFVGDVALDEYYKAEYFPRLREKVSVEALPPLAGGAIANAACVYAGYSQPVEFCGVLNGGPVSRMLLEDLRDNCVGTDMVMRDDKLPDSKTIVILAEGEHAILLPRMNIEKIELTPDALETLVNASLIYSNICEIKYLRSGEMTAWDILTKCKQNGALLGFDLDVADFRTDEERAYLSLIDIVFVNKIGFNSLCNGRPEDETLKELFAGGARLVVKTVAEGGVVVYSPNGSFSLPGVRVDVVDVTGAGDTFCASFLYAYERLGSVESACRFANYAAARSVSFMGARGGVAGVGPVLDFMRGHGEDTVPYHALLSGARQRCAENEFPRGEHREAETR